MKKQLLFIFALMGLTLISNAQVPEAFNYQAVIRDNSGAVIANQNVSLKISILQNSATGSVVYAETHSATTNNFGLVNLKIGQGTVVSGVFSPGGWGVTSHFLKVEVDPAGGSSYIHMGTSQLLSVPYAFHANTVENDQVDDDDADATNELQTISISGTQLTLSDGGGMVTLPSSGGGDNWGTQTVESDATLNGNGTSGSTLKIAQQEAGSGQVLKWNGSSWLPGDDEKGSSLWQQNGSDVYINDGNVGIGTSSPPFNLSIRKTGHATMELKSSLDALLYLDKGATNRYAGIDFKTNGMDKFWIGTLGNDNFMISTGWESLQGLKVETDGDVILSDNLLMAQGSKFGLGVTNPSYPVEIFHKDYSYQKFYHGSSGVGGSNGLLIGLQAVGNKSWIWSYENGPIIFGVNNSQKMVIEAGGDVGIGTSNPSSKLDVAGRIDINKNIATGQAMFVNGDEALWYNGTYFSWGYGADYNYFARSVAIATTTNPGGYELVVNGQAAKSGGGSWSTWSDSRLKNVHGKYTHGLAEIINLKPVTYNYKKGNKVQLPHDDEYVGLIAQDVQKVIPEAVSQGADGFLQLNMDPVNIALINAIKELNNKNIVLKNKINELETRLSKLEALIEISASK